MAEDDEEINNDNEDEDKGEDEGTFSKVGGMLDNDEDKDDSNDA